MRAQKWTLLKHFDGEPKDEDIQLEEFDLTDDLQENEVLTEALYLSVDPYMRPYSARFSVPMTMIGEQVAQVIKSKNEKFKVGTKVLANHGWVSHSITDGSDLRPITFDIGNTSLSYCLGALGMPGYPIYFVGF